jgi:hypothetical protein
LVSLRVTPKPSCKIYNWNGLPNSPLRGSGKKGGVMENEDIGNENIGNSIYPGLKSISDMSISGMSILIAIKWTYQK